MVRLNFSDLGANESGVLDQGISPIHTINLLVSSDQHYSLKLHVPFASAMLMKVYSARALQLKLVHLIVWHAS